MARTQPIRIALVGLGAIGRGQHLPAIRANPAFELVAVVDPAGADVGVPCHAGLDTLTDVEAVALAVPPAARDRLTPQALAAGWHVLLEKPPMTSAAAAAALRPAPGQALFAAWHSRHAPGVGPAAARLAGRTVRRVDIDWAEDVDVFHPGQDWIWQRGGFGVMDPGINALSILTAILPGDWHVVGAEFHVAPGAAMPDAGLVSLHGPAPAMLRLDWRHKGPPRWDIAIETDDGMVTLTHGGARLAMDGNEMMLPEPSEYEMVYRRFADLVARGVSEIDLAPLRLAEAALRAGGVA